MRSRFHRFLRHPFTRLLLSFGLTLLVAGGLSFLVMATGLSPTAIPGVLLGSLARAVGVVAVLLGLAWWLEGRGPERLGLGARGAAGQWGWGMLLGTALMSAVVGVLAVAGWYQPVEVLPGGALRSARDTLGWAVALLLVAIFEEVFFRGILFRLLEEWVGSGVALVVSSAFFGLVHLGNPHATPVSALAISLEAGVLLGGCYMLTRSLWFVSGVHFTWNWVQGAVLGVPVSGLGIQGLLRARIVGPEAWTGGDFGAEAGGVALLLCTTVGVAVVVAAARRGQWRDFLARRRERQAAAEAEAAVGAPGQAPS